jgi:potassium/hydrogen antiporter
MPRIEIIILIGGLLLLLGIASSKLSARLGLPVLVLFLFLGMLAGDEGIGRIAFENYQLAYGIGTLALVIILFDGGLGTSVSAFRAVWPPSLLLATLGVLITAVVTGLAAAWILNLSVLEGLLLGSIVGSTDAAAVFSILRHGGIVLPKRLASTLEVESASNDPMAIFLTIGCIELLTGRAGGVQDLVGLFLAQMIIGAVGGLASGFLAVRIINRINLAASGLYPVLVTAFGLLAFGASNWLGGSGFLAVYLAGLVIGNNRIAFQRGIRLFHDAAAWLAQIVMFVVLGLLSFPSRMIAVSLEGLLVGVVLILLARPIAVGMIAPFFRFNGREMLFLSWVGLKGAVPITLATFPLLAGIPQAPLIFDVVFFVVVLSAVIQGWTMPYLARRLGLELPAEPKPPVTLEIMSLQNVDGEIVDFAVSADSRAAGRRVKELALPAGAVIALIVRQNRIIPPHGNTRIEAGDHAILVLHSETIPLVTKTFAAGQHAQETLPRLIEFPLRPNAKVSELEDAYGIQMDAPADWTLAEAIRDRLGDQGIRADTMVRFGPIALHVRGLSPRGTIEHIGMVILIDDDVPSKN